MCGIAGLMTTNGRAPDAGVLERLAAALVHRGPDGEGRYAAGDVGFVQRRLAIIDLATGDQPLFGPDGTALVANAEIYNYLELKAARPKVAWRTASDCEPPLQLYKEYGLDFARHLRGMYAIALHDPTGGRLVLARDPFGIKPLYYAETTMGLAFASEPQALISSGLMVAKLELQRRGELVQLQYTTGRRTIFEGIQRVLPGETIVVSAGRIVERRRVFALPEGGPEDIGEAEAILRLDRALEDSVGVHQRSDVPYGMFLSGGVDSSAVLALMARLNARPVRAFTIGFPGTHARDERALAQNVARALGAEHVEIAFEEADFWTLLPRVAAALDDPCADYATLPTFKLALEARKSVKVVLSGEGGDELFAGYGRYRSAMRPWWQGGRAMRGRGMLDGLSILRREATGWRDGVVSAEAMASAGGRSRLQAAQAADVADWLPNDLLTKLDRCLMANGVEGRTPFLDPAVAAAAFCLPDRMKVRDGRGKWLLRQWLAERVPTAQAFSPKRGFTVPVAEWIARHGGRLGALVAAQPGIVELCRPEAVRKVFRATGKRAGFAAWSLLFYALWHRRHILGLVPEGDAFEALADVPREARGAT